MGLSFGTSQQSPTQIVISNVVAIAAGYRQSVFVKQDGTVWSCGNNLYGKLGDGTTTNRLTPVVVSTLNGIIGVATGLYHTLFLKNNGTAWSAGNNFYGQLGNSSTINSATPVQVSNLTGTNNVVAGTNNSLFSLHSSQPQQYEGSSPSTYLLFFSF